MRVVVVDTPGSAEVIRLAETAESSLGGGEVLIQVAYASGGYVDTLLRSGDFGLPTPSVPAGCVPVDMRRWRPRTPRWSFRYGRG